MPEFYSWGLAFARVRDDDALRLTLSVIAREGGQSSIPEAARLEPRGCGVLDAPPARGMTAEFGAAACLFAERAYPGILTGSVS